MPGDNNKKVIIVASTSFTHSSVLHLYRLLASRVEPEYELKQVIVFGGQNEKEKQKLISALEYFKPCALIGLCIKPDISVIRSYREAGVPAVIIDENVDGFTTVATDNMAGGYMAAEHLIRSGRKSIGLIIGRLNIKGSYTADMRFMGFQKAMRDNNIEFNMENMYETTHYTSAEGVEGVNMFFKSKNNIDAIFSAAGDIVAAGVISACESAGIKIPSQVALIGYDDMEFARSTVPALTTVKQPFDLMADKAYEAVTSAREITLNTPGIILLNPELVKRDSA